MEFIPYTFRTANYQAQTNITLDQWSNAITFKNNGNSLLIVDNDTLQPTESKSIGGIYNGILRKRLSISFAPILNPPVGYVQADSCTTTEVYFLPQEKFSC